MGTYLEHSFTLFPVKEVFLSARKHLFMVAINSAIPDCLPKDSQNRSSTKDNKRSWFILFSKLRGAKKEIYLSHNFFSVLLQR